MRNSRTKKYNSDGSRIYNTFNSTGLVNKYENHNARFDSRNKGRELDLVDSNGNKLNNCSCTIAGCGIDPADTDTDKVEKVLDFVYGLVDYELEIDDSLRAPVETLSLKSGDCDDFSILVAALLEAVDIQTGIGFFESPDSAHAMVLVQMDDLEGYRCWYYDDLTYYDFEPGRWLIIEPQLPIGYQDIDDTMEEYDIYMAVELDFDKVVS